MKNKIILKEFGVLLIAAVLTLSAIVVIAIPREPKLPIDTRYGTIFDFQKMNILSPYEADNTTLLYESFEEGVMPPGCWSINDTCYYTWRITNYSDYVHSGDYAAWIYGYLQYERDEWLITPQLNLTGWDTVTLEFWALSYTSSPETTVELHIRGEGGIYDIILWNMTEDENWENLSYRRMTFDLSSYIGDNINISWRYISSYYDYQWGFALDDVVVYATGKEPLIAEAGGPYETTVNEEIHFIGNSSGGTYPHSYLWDFGNGDTSESQNPSYTYEEPGVYQITLTVDDGEENLDVDYAIAIVD
jgi:hypothetical protein